MCDDDQALVVLYAVVAVKSPTEPVRALAQYVAAAGNFQKVALRPCGRSGERRAHACEELLSPFRK